MDNHGVFYWNELMSWDAESSKAFYGAALGWTFEAMPLTEGGTYWLAKAGDKSVGGIFPMSGGEFAGMPEHWFSYIAVDDVDKRVAQAKEKGATLPRPIFDVPGIGRIAIVTDPGGATLGWMTPVEAE